MEGERAVAARFMECFAGYLSHADEQIGRVLDFLAETGDADNTIVVAVSDNGASAEGGLRCDGREVGRAVIPRFTPSRFGAGAGLTCGYEWGPAIGPGYAAPFPFAGTIRRAYVETMGPVVRGRLAELEAIVSEQ